ncbi:MAG: hypothetical protein ACRDLP_06240, partial [Solirubrobacteraceae bacterium]
MSTDATQEHARLIVTEPAAGTPAQLLRPTPHAIALPRPRWRDPSSADMFRSTLATGASAASLAVMIVTSLVVVSLAAARPGILIPTAIENAVAHNGSYPAWLAGPTGGLTSWFSASAHADRVFFTTAIAVMLVAYLVVVNSARRLRPSWIFGSILVLHVIFFLSPPLNLSDVFNYLNYGRMESVYRLNPYTTIPALEPHTDPTFLFSNWHGLLSPYGPLFTLFAIALVPLGVAGSLWAMKAVLMVASLATVYLVYRCAQLLGRNPLAAAAIVGINPIVLVWGLGGDHNDFLMMFFLVLAFWLLLRARAMRVGRRARPTPPNQSLLRRGWAWLDGMPRPLADGEPAAWMEVAAGIALVAAVAIKASSAVLIPIILCGTARRMRLAVGIVIGLAGAAAMTYIAFGLNLPNLGQQDRLVIPEGIPNLAGLALGFGGETTQMRNVLTVLLVAVVAGCCIWAWQSRRWLTQCGWVTFALIVTLSWTLPWYIVWLLPFA